MPTVNIHEAKTHFSKLVANALAGKETIIGKHGVPVAKIVPIVKRAEVRTGGQLKGKLHIAKDFDKLPKSFMKYFTK
jgi:prevent-host-death family protein